MARNRSVSEGLGRFLDRETFTLTVNGAIGRNKTYCNGIASDRKRGFRESLRGCLYSEVFGISVGSLALAVRFPLYPQK